MRDLAHASSLDSTTARDCHISTASSLPSLMYKPLLVILAPSSVSELLTLSGFCIFACDL